jgi:alkylated DNA repair dioxygenase AlkB
MIETLFAVERNYPPGFSYTPSFLTLDEEAELLKVISAIHLHTFNFQGFEAKRKVASFGFDYSFDNRGLAKGNEIPVEFHSLINKVAGHTSISPEAFSELLVTEYPVGSVINWHRDAFPFDVIAGISLHSDCNFRLRPQEKTKQGRGSIISFPVERRSLYVISGEARTEWQHSISPVKALRYSITLRTLKQPTKNK